MIKRASKITSLIVAAATMISLVPASAADAKKINSEDGTIYNAIAYKDGKAIIDGEIDKNDGAYYLTNGKYNELKDIDSGSDYTSYGTKYANVDDGDNFVDLETGKVADDDDLDEDDEDDAASALRKKIKDSKRYIDSTSSKTVFGDKDTADLKEINGNKFSELWYETKIAEDKHASSDVQKAGLKDGVIPYFTLYTNTKGNYIDADYNLGKIKVSTTCTAAVTTSAAVTIENTKDTYDLRGADDTFAKISQSISLGQDSTNIYRYAVITVKTISDKNGEVFINGKAFKATGTPGTASTVDLKVIQKISKAQDSDDIDDAKYAKTVTNYVISDDEAKNLGTSGDEQNYFNLASDTTNDTKASVIGGKLVLFQVEDNSNDDNVKAQAATLRSKNGYYYTDVEEKTTITAEYNDDIDKTAFDTDVDGNIYVLDSGYVKKFDGTDDWDKVYKVDGSMDGLSVYDKDNMVVWSQGDEVYSLIGAKTADKDPDTTTPTTKPVETPSGITGWVQATDGNWNYINAGGNKAVGWFQDGPNWYYTSVSGAMLTGWQYVGGTWYYLNPVSDGTKGAMKTGWINDGGTWYYLNPVSDGTKGAMKTGWIYDNGTWYYCNGSGAWVR